MTRTIRYLTAPCALGQMLVAAGERGIAHLRFGDDANEMSAAFRAERPGAQPAQAAACDPLPAWIDALVARLALAEDLDALPDLPLEDAAGTPFQQRVWGHLRTIPLGETRSYGAVARSVGSRGAARAVASACARNPLAWLVPCHRVLAATGRPAGYRWGLERQAWLLAMEAQASRWAAERSSSTQRPQRAVRAI